MPRGVVLFATHREALLLLNYRDGYGLWRLPRRQKIPGHVAETTVKRLLIRYTGLHIASNARITRLGQLTFGGIRYACRGFAFCDGEAAAIKPSREYLYAVLIPYRDLSTLEKLNPVDREIIRAFAQNAAQTPLP